MATYAKCPYCSKAVAMEQGALGYHRAVEGACDGSERQVARLEVQAHGPARAVLMAASKGDVIEVISGPHQGKLGHIEYVGSAGQGYACTLEDGTKVNLATSQVKVLGSGQYSVMATEGKFKCPDCGEMVEANRAGNLEIHFPKDLGWSCLGSGKRATMSLMGIDDTSPVRNAFTGDTVECPICHRSGVAVQGISPKMAQHDRPSGGICSGGGRYVTEFSLMEGDHVTLKARFGGKDAGATIRQVYGNGSVLVKWDHGGEDHFQYVDSDYWVKG